MKKLYVIPFASILFVFLLGVGGCTKRFHSPNTRGITPIITKKGSSRLKIFKISNTKIYTISVDSSKEVTQIISDFYENQKIKKELIKKEHGKIVEKLYYENGNLKQITRFTNLLGGNDHIKKYNKYGLITEENAPGLRKIFEYDESKKLLTHSLEKRGRDYKDFRTKEVWNYYSSSNNNSKKLLKTVIEEEIIKRAFQHLDYYEYKKSWRKRIEIFFLLNKKETLAKYTSEQEWKPTVVKITKTTEDLEGNVLNRTFQEYHDGILVTF